jgi:hypothetical protein
MLERFVGHDPDFAGSSRIQAVPRRISARGCRFRAAGRGSACLVRRERVEIDHALILALRPEAARRDMTVPRLINDLLDVIASDGLVGAVLDIDDNARAPPP